MSPTSQGTDDAFLGQHPRGKKGLPAVATVLAPGEYLEVNPSENKYFRHLDTSPPKLPSHVLGDSDLSQESVRAASHLLGPPTPGPLSISLGSSLHGQDIPESWDCVSGVWSWKGWRGPWPSHGWESLRLSVPPVFSAP